MSKLQDRICIVNEINQAALLYKQNLAGKKFLYVFDGRYIEVIFKIQNFRHLTGVATSLSATRFFSYALKGILQAQQIWFDSRHPYDLCVRKVKHLSQITALASTGNFVLEEIITDRKNFKFGTTDLNFSLCLDKEYDNYGNEKGECYVVESLRDEDCFSKSKSAYEVTHILSMPNDQKKYSNIVFVEDGYTIGDLPDEVKELVSFT